MDGAFNQFVFTPPSTPLQIIMKNIIPPRVLKNQIILTGMPDDIDKVVAKLHTWDTDVAIYNQPHLKYTLTDIFPPTNANPDIVSTFSGIEVREYSLIIIGDNSEERLWDLIATIYEKQAEWKNDRNISPAEKPDGVVLADLNLVTANPVSNGSGSVNGGTLGAAESVDGNTGGRNLEEVYRTHWVFREHCNQTFNQRHAEGRKRRQLNLFCRGINPMRQEGDRFALGPGELGEGSRVYVLDTLDEALIPAEKVVTYNDVESTPVVRFDGLANFKLFITRMGPNVSFVPAMLTKSKRSHGLYVCGLINRVAPAAELHLVEVLDNEGNGELFNLSRALAWVAHKEWLKADRTLDADPLENVVVNLSLEGSLDENLMASRGVRRGLIALAKAFDPDRGKANLMLKLLDEMVDKFYYLPALRLPIMLLRQLGAVVVAAAGNHSASVYGHLPMTIPSRYPEVIGVAASNYAGNLASFSNQGDVLAPGGGDGNDENIEEDISNLCEPGDDLSPFAICGVVAQEANSNSAGLAFWWGTSFAAPLVSGLAALVQAKLLKNHKPGKNVDAMRTLIKNQLTDDIIDVRRTIRSL